MYTGLRGAGSYREASAVAGGGDEENVFFPSDTEIVAAWARHRTSTEGAIAEGSEVVGGTRDDHAAAAARQPSRAPARVLARRRSQ